MMKEGGERLQRGERYILLVLWVATAGFIGLMIAASWPDYWRYVASETAPLAWLESVLLLLTAFVAGLMAFTENASGGSRKTGLSWAVMAAAFVWLSLDERFALHERLRDRFLKPTGLRLLPWMEAGDWIIPLYAVCGLAAVWSIWRLLGRNRTARRFFAAALLLAFWAVAMDTINIRELDKDTERLLQSVEEVLETIAMASFLSAFLCVWTRKIGGLIHQAQGLGKAEFTRGPDVL
jgi:hypothetical protein